MKAGDKTYLAKACSDSKFNGQIATKTGAQTFPPNRNQAGLDKAQFGSKAGILKK